VPNKRTERGELREPKESEAQIAEHLPGVTPEDLRRLLELRHPDPEKVLLLIR